MGGEPFGSVSVRLYSCVMAVVQVPHISVFGFVGRTLVLLFSLLLLTPNLVDAKEIGTSEKEENIELSIKTYVHFESRRLNLRIPTTTRGEFFRVEALDESPTAAPLHTDRDLVIELRKLLI